MDFFANLLELVAPTPPRGGVSIRISSVEAGTELAVTSIDGGIFTVKRGKHILAVTDTQIIELRCHPTKAGIATAVDVHELQALVKLKFKRGDQAVLLLEYERPSSKPRCRRLASLGT
jgi:hypothetical protein